MSTELTFSSCFESGNLAIASARGHSDYDLIIDSDTNTNGHEQWYYFAVGNTRAGTTITFNLMNMSKGKSLYSAGMQPLVWSWAGNGLPPLPNASQAEQQQHESKVEKEKRNSPTNSVGSDFLNSVSVGGSDASWTHAGWQVGGCTGLRWYKSELKKKNGEYYHALSFKYTFKYSNDTVFFSQHYPYTYTMYKQL